ncbi:MAG: CYTH domain-containing protein [Clostridiales bacterium]|jgi:uncharacterized protein YjbK|nr:CYTH domain-containing protein [Clostridiales bacterium]
MRREREFKTLIDADKYAQILCRSPAEKSYTQTNYYFDTAGAELLAGGVSLRVREKGGAYEMTFKTGNMKVGSVHSRFEYDAPISEKDFRQFLAEGVPLSFFTLPRTDAAPGPNIRYVGKVQTLRSVIGLSDGSFIELDKNEYAGAVDYELEYEYDAPDEPPAFAAFLADNGVAPGVSESKYARLRAKQGNYNSQCTMHNYKDNAFPNAECRISDKFI